MPGSARCRMSPTGKSLRSCSRPRPSHPTCARPGCESPAPSPDRTGRRGGRAAGSARRCRPRAASGDSDEAQSAKRMAGHVAIIEGARLDGDQPGQHGVPRPASESNDGPNGVEALTPFRPSVAEIRRPDPNATSCRPTRRLNRCGDDPVQTPQTPGGTRADLHRWDGGHLCGDSSPL